MAFNIVTVLLMHFSQGEVYCEACYGGMLWRHVKWDAMFLYQSLLLSTTLLTDNIYK